MIRIIRPGKKLTDVYIGNCECGCLFEANRADISEDYYDDPYMKCPNEECKQVVYLVKKT